MPNKINSRNEYATSIIELAIGIAVLLPIVLVVFDLAVITLGCQVNDSTCREAARAAAKGNPSDLTDLENRAQAIVNQANKNTKGMLSNFKLIKPVTTIPDQAQIQAQMQTLRGYGGPVSGTVTVATEVDMRPFIVKYAYAGKDPITFRAQHSFPFTFVVPTTAAPSP